MKITYNFFNMQPSNKNKGKTAQPQPQSMSTNRNRNCDEIIIRGKIEKPDQNPFIDELKTKISTEVKATCPEEKINALKQQIEDGTYKVEIDQIAKKMLLQ